MAMKMILNLLICILLISTVMATFYVFDDYDFDWIYELQNVSNISAAYYCNATDCYTLADFLVAPGAGGNVSSVNAGVMIYLTGDSQNPVINVNETVFNTTTDARITLDYIKALGFNITSDLDNYFLVLSDQRFNETPLIQAVNTSTNINALFPNNDLSTDKDTKHPLNTTTIHNLTGSATVNETWLESFISGKITQGFIENLGFVVSSTIQSWISGNNTQSNNRIDSLNTSKLDKTDQRFNETDQIQTNNNTLINYILNNNNSVIAYVSTNNNSVIAYILSNNGSIKSYILTQNQAQNISLDYHNSFIENASLGSCDKVTGLAQNGTPICGVDQTGGGGGLNASQVKDELGFFVNMTAVKHNGSWVSGGLTGYAAGNDLCNSEFSGTHACWAHEIANHISYNHSFSNFTNTFWIGELAPGFTANANDCAAHKTDLATALGAIQVGSTTDGGAGGLVSCGATRSIGCCK